MSRGFAQISIIAVVLSAVVFGSGGYFISQQINKTSDSNTQDLQANAAISTTRERQYQTKDNEAASGSQPEIKSKNKIEDVCLNIEGIQSSIPTGLIESTNNECIARTIVVEKLIEKAVSATDATNTSIPAVVETDENEGELYLEFVENAPYSFASSTGAFVTINLFNQTGSDVIVRGLTVSIELNAWGQIDETGYLGARITAGESGNNKQTSVGSIVTSNPFEETIYFKGPLTLPKLSGNQIFIDVNGSEKKTGVQFVKFTIEDVLTDGERDFDYLPESINVTD